jgi:hypothetical protein
MTVAVTLFTIAQCIPMQNICILKRRLASATGSRYVFKHGWANCSLLYPKLMTKERDSRGKAPLSCGSDR